jgi:hypothetical protein
MLRFELAALHGAQAGLTLCLVEQDHMQRALTVMGDVVDDTRVMRWTQSNCIRICEGEKE